MTSEFERDFFSGRFFSVKADTKSVDTIKWDPRWSRLWSIYCIGGHKGDPLFKYIDDFWFLYLSTYNLLIDYFFTDCVIDNAYHRFEDVREGFDSIPDSNANTLALSSMLNADKSSYKSTLPLIFISVRGKLILKCWISMGMKRCIQVSIRNIFVDRRITFPG